MTFGLIFFTVNLTISLVILVLNRNVPHRSSGDLLIASFIVIFMLDMAFGIRDAIGSGEHGFLSFPSLLFGYAYAPLLFLSSFTSEEKPLFPKAMIHGIPILISLIVFIVIQFFSFEEKTLLRIYSVLQGGVLLSYLGYFLTGMVLLKRGNKMNFLSNRFLFWFWGGCLMSLTVSGIYGLQFQSEFPYLVMMPLWTAILWGGLMIHLYCYYYLRFGKSDSAKTFTFYFESEILDQIRNSDEKGERYSFVENDLADIDDVAEKIKFLEPDLDLSSFADQLGLSVSFLERKLKEETGLSFKNFVNMKRISHAKDLIEAKPELSLEELMLNCGFRSRATFYRNFKNHAGMTPGEYATKLRNQKSRKR